MIYDYFCKCGAIKADELVKTSDEKVLCNNCKRQMVKGLSAPTLLGFDKNGTSKSGGHGKANR
jgi:predicted nucleic acid-binding Zn ribbon protein